MGHKQRGEILNTVGHIQRGELINRVVLYTCKSGHKLLRSFMKSNSLFSLYFPLQGQFRQQADSDLSSSGQQTRQQADSHLSSGEREHIQYIMGVGCIQVVNRLYLDG